MTEFPQIFMVQLNIDTRLLWGRARALGLSALRELDLGYLVHTQLVGLFGDLAPRPFRVEERQGSVRVLGYSTEPWEHLSDRARAVADPAVWSVVRWEECAAKPMPEAWREGSRFSFAVRVCPVVRKSGTNGSSGAIEKDVYLARCDSPDPEAAVGDRYVVYAEWLRSRLERENACRVRSAEVVGFRLASFVRSRHEEGKRRVLRRPDAEIRGEIEVASSAAFGRLVAQGIGRHRSFGFGMLLLRPGARC